MEKLSARLGRKILKDMIKCSNRRGKMPSVPDERGEVINCGMARLHTLLHAYLYHAAHSHVSLHTPNTIKSYAGLSCMPEGRKLDARGHTNMYQFDSGSARINLKHEGRTSSILRYTSSDNFCMLNECSIERGRCWKWEYWPCIHLPHFALVAIARLGLYIPRSPRYPTNYHFFS